MFSDHLDFDLWTEGIQLQLFENLFCVMQAKYKEAGKKEVNSCLYSLLPATLETQHAKETSELLSEVRAASFLSVPLCYFTKWNVWMNIMFVSLCESHQVKYKESRKKEMSSSLYSTLPDTSETNFAREMTDVLSEVPTLMNITSRISLCLGNQRYVKVASAWFF